MTSQRAVLFASFMALISYGHPPLLAQEDTARSGSGNGDDEAICMTRVFRDVPQVRRDQQGGSFAVIIVRNSARSLASKGFDEIACEDVKLGTLEQQARYREDMCELAANGNQAVQSQYEKALGERPAVLCANAQLATGVERDQVPAGSR